MGVIQNLEIDHVKSLVITLFFWVWTSIYQLCLGMNSRIPGLWPIPYWALLVTGENCEIWCNFPRRILEAPQLAFQESQKVAIVIQTCHDLSKNGSAIIKNEILGYWYRIFRQTHLGFATWNDGDGDFFLLHDPGWHMEDWQSFGKSYVMTLRCWLDLVRDWEAESWRTRWDFPQGFSQREFQLKPQSPPTTAICIKIIGFGAV